MSANVLRTLIMRVVSVVLLFTAFAAYANPVIPLQTQPQQPSFIPTAPAINANGYILLDATSGKILAEKNPDIRIPPASLTKLMSLYVISSAIKNGQIHWDDKVRISTKAWKTEGSRMFVKAGEEVPVRSLLQGIIVASGNDATVALAEYVAGSEEAFISIMNQQANLLGMKNTHFMDSTGLPNKDHYSTPHDLAILTQAYINNFPEDYGYYSQKWFMYNGVKQPNRNRLLWRFQYADGLKTGHTNEAGFCLVASAKKDGMRLISVILGAPSDAARTEDSIRLLTYGFRFFETHQLFHANKTLTEARVWQGTDAKTPLGIEKDYYITIPTGQFKRIQASFNLTNPIKAPVSKGQSYGQVKVTLNNQVVDETPLVALQDNPKGNLWRRTTDLVKYTLHRYFSSGEETINTG
jgi:D-alanyl-D-alanine carboxypeptidase (penicillin-binding protein 5/6)